MEEKCQQEDHESPSSVNWMTREEMDCDLAAIRYRQSLYRSSGLALLPLLHPHLPDSVREELLNGILSGTQDVDGSIQTRTTT
jgi:hypothetical protein